MFLNTSDLRDQEIYLSLYNTDDENKDKGYVPAYYFSIVRLRDNAIVGRCDLRIGHNENTKYGGNIGKVFITCSPDNIASRRTCELSGGILIDILDIPSWHEMYEMGRRQTCQYVVRV